ncbi:MAG: DUF4271 domain-containing protein [Mucinivorans sp.]
MPHPPYITHQPYQGASAFESYIPQEVVWPVDTLTFNYLPKAARNQGEIFSYSSLAYTSKEPPLSLGYSTDNSWQVATVCLPLICLYCYIMHRHWRLLGVVIKSTLSVRGSLMFIDESYNEYHRFLNLATLTANLSLAIGAGAMVMANEPTIHGWKFLVAGISAIGLVFVGRLIITLLMQLGDPQLTLHKVSNKLWKFDLSIFAIFLTPLMLVMAVNPSLHYALIATILLVIVVHQIRQAIYFSLNKFSFMQWILYLCTVELFPLSLIVAAVVKF